MNAQKKPAYKNKIIHSLRTQCIETLNSLDCVLLTYICLIHGTKFNHKQAIEFILNTSQKADRCIHSLMNIKLSRTHIISPLNLSLALEISQMLSSIISNVSRIMYVIVAISKYKEFNAIKGYVFIDECITSTRSCIIIVDKIIDGSEDIFTNHKLKKIKFLTNKVKNTFASVHKNYANVIALCYSEDVKTPYEHALLQGLVDIYTFMFTSFEIAYSIVTKITVTLKHL